MRKEWPGRLAGREESCLRKRTSWSDSFRFPIRSPLGPSSPPQCHSVSRDAPLLLGHRVLLRLFNLPLTCSQHPHKPRYNHIALWPLFLFWAFRVAIEVKSSSANAGDIRDVGLIPGSGRSPGGGHGNPLQYFCLENPRRSLVGYNP